MKLLTYYKNGIIFILKSPLVFIKYFFTGIKQIFITLPFFIIKQIITLFKNSKSPKQIISAIFLLLSLISYLSCIFIITRWFVQTERNERFTESLTENFGNITVTETINEYHDTNISNDIIAEEQPQVTQPATPQTPIQQTTPQNYSPTFLNVNLNYYINQNSETVGWIKIDGTKVNYPVVQHSDNKYYLEHDFYNKETSVGWIYSDFRNNFENFNNNTVIYGHNLINGAMFGSLPTFVNKNWKNKTNQHYIKLSTKNSNTIWQIFSVYTIDPVTDYLQTSFYSIESYQIFLNKIKARSIHNIDIPVNYTDKILTLSTCNNTGTQRIAIHAKLIQIETK